MFRTDIFRARRTGCCLLLATLLLHGCNLPGSRKATPPPPQPVVTVEATPEWEQTALAADVERLHRLDQAWADALEAARKAGFRRSIASEGKLLEPEAALARPAPGPGSYMCKLIQIAPVTRRARAYAASKPGFCYVGVDEDGRLWLARQTGALRREGYLLEDENGRRLIFLGSFANGSKDAAPAYGTVPERSTSGVFERVGPLRYRLVTPSPKGFKLEVMELTPAPLQHDE